MKVLTISHSYVDVENRHNIDALRKLGVDSRVLLPNRWKLPLHGDVPALAEDGYVIGKSVRLLGAEYLLFAFSRPMDHFVPDIVHLEYPPWAVISLQFALYARRYWPSALLICTAKKNTYRRYQGPASYGKNWIAQKSLASFAGIQYVSEKTRSLYEQQFGPTARSFVAPQLGVDLSRFTPSTVDRHKAIGFAGRLDESKGIISLLEACDILNGEASTGDFSLRLVGSGPLRPWLDAQAVTRPWLTIDNAIPHQMMPEFFRQIGIFVMPSLVLPDHEEHDGQAIMEALAAGLPCVGTNSGIIPELLGGGTGLLVDPDKPRALADSIRYLGDNTSALERMRHIGRQRAVAEFGTDAVAYRKLQFYERLLQKAPANE